MPLAKGRTPPKRGKRPPPKQYTAMHRVADAAAPKLAAALQSSLHTVAIQRVTLRALAEGFASGTTADAVHAIPWGGLENDLYHRLYPVLLHLVTSAAQAMEPLPLGAIDKAKPDPDVQATLAYAFDVTNPRAAEWARLTASYLALDLAAESQQAVRSMVVRMFEEGIPPVQAARRLRAMIGLNRFWADAIARYQQTLAQNAVPIPADLQTKLVQQYATRALAHRAEVIARTESARAAVAGQQALWRDQIDKGILDASRVRQVWLVTPDERLCPACSSIPSSRNQPPVGQDFYVPYTGETISGPPQHPNCVLGDTFITTREQIAAYSQRRYEGEVVVIRTRGGNHLTCTPNHPILTGRGWVGAGELNESDHLVCHTGWNNSGLDLTHHYVPSRIEEIAHSLAQASGVTTGPVPVAAEDFHGDGGGSKVAVIGAYRTLGNHRCAACGQHIEEPFFRPVEVASPLNGDRFAVQPLDGDGATADGPMGGSHLALAAPRRHLRPLERFSRRPTARLDALLQQETSDGVSVDTDAVSQLIFGHPGRIQLDQLASVCRNPFTGHVYNLDTGRGVYGANGIITHNCRCDVALLVANADGSWPAPPSLLEEVLAYAGADGPPASRILAPAVPAAYR